MVIQRDGSYLVVGVFSTLHSTDCEVGGPARFMRVTSHREWISQNWIEAIPV